MKKILATLSDKNYMLFGLTLYESLVEYSEDFVLHYLAMDEETARALRGLPNIIIHRLYELEDDSMWETLVKNNPSKPGELSPFHWALGSFFTYHILQHNYHCLYVDADIIFYRDVGEIIEAMLPYSVGVVGHKHVDPQQPSAVGYFNVGVVFFRYDFYGYPCCRWWRDVVADKNTPFHQGYGTCGDQKYLELFPYIAGKDKVHILDESIGHGAPWNFTRSTIKDGVLTWNAEFVTGETEKVQPLVFNHFSHFRPDFENGTYKVDFDGEWGNILPNKGITEVYDHYYEACKATKEKYSL